ncbi:MAG: Yip1 family protein [Longimicrobiales bacterium]
MTTHSEARGDATPARVATEPTASRWEDYVDIFISPASVFRRRRSGGVTHPIVTLAVSSFVLYFIILPANMRAFQRSAPTPEATAFMEQWGLLFQVAGGFFAPVMVLLGVTFAAVILSLVCRVLSVQVTFKDTFLIAAYAAFIYLLSTAATGLVTMIQGGAIDPVRDLSFGVLRFTGADGMSPPVATLLKEIDLFAIWQAILWGVGLRIIGNASRSQAVAAASVAWILVALPGILMSTLAPTPPITAPPPS